MKLKQLINWSKFLDWCYENQITVCIGCGLIGFLIAIVLLFASTSKYSPYGTFVFHKKDTVISAMLDRRIKVINDLKGRRQKSADSLQKLINDTPTTNQKLIWATDLIKASTDVSKLNSYYWLTQREKIWLQSRNTDTAMAYYSRYLQVDKHRLVTEINAKAWIGDTARFVAIPASVSDTCRCLPNSPVTVKTTLMLKQDKRDSLLDWISDYPAFGFWLVLGIAQLMLWFILIPMLAGNLLSLKTKLGNNYSLTLKQRWINALVPILVLGIFCLVFYQVMVDRFIITDGYFLNHFKWRMIIYGGIGYAVAAFCFYNFLTLANQFDSVNTMFMNVLATPSTNNSTALDKYQSLNNAFNNAFICSAAVLSMFVFSEGVLINAVNGTEVIRFYQQINGQPLIPADFVYLMGLLHTCILLLFYIPVKLKFSTLAVTQPATQVAAGAPVKNMFSTLFSSLGTILVTASPLIAGFVQSLLKVFFG